MQSVVVDIADISDYGALSDSIGARVDINPEALACRVDVELDVPKEMGGPGGPGTNPEQLFAVGYAACFQSALLRFANGRGLDLSEARVTARVGIGLLKSGGLGLAVALDLDAPALSRDVAVDLMNRAHETCPYSRATRGNIVVTLTVSGSRLERQAA